MKLDIFGEIVVTLGTTPQGQGHETSPSHGRRRHPRLSTRRRSTSAPATTPYWNSHAGFSGTYASQFAVTGLSAVKGATEAARRRHPALAAGVLGADGPDDIVLEGGFAKRRRQPGGGAAVLRGRRDHQREQRRPPRGAPRASR